MSQPIQGQVLQPYFYMTSIPVKGIDSSAIFVTSEVTCKMLTKLRDLTHSKLGFTNLFVYFCCQSWVKRSLTLSNLQPQYSCQTRIIFSTCSGRAQSKLSVSLTHISRMFERARKSCAHLNQSFQINQYYITLNSKLSVEFRRFTPTSIPTSFTHPHRF